MSDQVQFDTDIQTRRTFPTSQSVSGQPETSGMAAWLARHGIAKSEATASNILIAVVVINFLIAVALVYFFVIH